MSLAQQVSAESIKRIIDAREAYFQAHPEMRPEALAAAKAAAGSNGHPDSGCAKPIYPKESLRFEQQGKVELEFLIDTDGSVVDSRIKKSSGFPILDTAAIDGLSKCRFRAVTQDDKPVRQWVKVAYVFSLE
jgi:TonB family protein